MTEGINVSGTDRSYPTIKVNFVRPGKEWAPAASKTKESLAVHSHNARSPKVVEVRYSKEEKIPVY